MRPEDKTWVLCDSLKKSMSLGVFSLGFPLVLAQSLGAGAPYTAQTLLASSLLAANLVTAVVAPLLGRAADRRGVGRLLVPLGVGSAVLMTLVGVSSRWHPYVSCCLFILAFAVFQVQVSLWDSLLRRLAAPGQCLQLSFRAWAWGFCGSILVLMLVALNGGMDSRLLLLLGLGGGSLSIVAGSLLRRGAGRGFVSASSQVAGDAALRRVVLRLLLVHNGIDTLTAFIPLFFVQHVGLDQRVLLALLLWMQMLALPATLICGKVAQRVGSERMLIMSLLAWMVISILVGTFSGGVGFAAAVFSLTGLVLGTSKALLRAELSDATPEWRRAEVFGWATGGSRLLVSTGPLLAALASHIGQPLQVVFIFNAVFFAAAILVPSRSKMESQSE